MTTYTPAQDGGSLVQTAMQAVTRHIHDNAMRVGDTLPGEGHFAEILGVSRAVMREAFGALAALKLIDVGNGRKPRVGRLDGSVITASMQHAISTAQITVPEIWDVRRTIEGRSLEPGQGFFVPGLDVARDEEPLARLKPGPRERLRLRRGH